MFPSSGSTQSRRVGGRGGVFGGRALREVRAVALLQRLGVGVSGLGRSAPGRVWQETGGAKSDFLVS